MWLSPTAAGSARRYWTKPIFMFGDKACHCRYIKTAVIWRDWTVISENIWGKWLAFHHVVQFSRSNIDFIEAQRREVSQCAGLPGAFLTFLPFFFVYIGSRVLYTQVTTMSSLMSRVRPVQRSLAVSLRLRTNTEGSKYATAENKRFSSGVNACTDPLRATRRSYCSRMVVPQGLLFRQVR